MCLFVKSIEPKISEEEIIAYKIVEKKNSGYYSPFMNMPISFNVVNNNIYNVITDKNAKYSDKVAIYGGVFHLFKNCTDAVNELLNLEIYGYFNYEIIKAIIPINTEYYEGGFNGFVGISKNYYYDGIATKRVIYESLNE